MRNLKLLKLGSVYILRWEQIHFSKRYVLKKFRPKDEAQRNGHVFVRNKALTNSDTCFFYVHVAVHRNKFLYNKTN